MTTLVDLRRLAIEADRGSARAATHAWSLYDDAGAQVGFVVEQVGSAVSLLRRHLSSHPYRNDTSFEVTDLSGAVELVLNRAPSNFLKTHVRIAATLADGQPVATAEQTGAGVRGAFEATDPDGNPIARIERITGTQWIVTDPFGEALGEVAFLPPTRSVVRPDGRTTERFEIEHTEAASARVRVAVLAAMVASGSFRPG